MADLPYTPVTDGFSIQHGNDMRVFEPIFGKRRVRRIGIGNPDVMQFTWILNPTEYTGFLNFYYATLSAGTLTFTMTLNGVSRTCRFIDVLSTNQVDGLTYSVGATVEVLR